MKRLTVFMLMLALLVCEAHAQSVVSQKNQERKRKTAEIYGKMHRIKAQQDAQMWQMEMWPIESWEGFAACLEKNGVALDALEKEVEEHQADLWQFSVFDSLRDEASALCLERGAQYVLELLRANRYQEVANMPDLDLMFLLGPAVESYYEELYGQAVMFDEAYHRHAEEFKSKFFPRKLRMAVGAVLKDAREPSGEKIISRLILEEPIGKMVKWAMYAGWQVDREPFCGKTMEKLLNETYGASVENERKDLFHDFKRGVFNEFLKETRFAKDKACFQKMMIAPITQEQRNIVNKTIKTACGGPYEYCVAYKKNVADYGYWVDKGKIRAVLGKGLHPRSVNGHIMPMK